MNWGIIWTVFWCCAGALCNSTIAFSLGILQNYIYSAFQYTGTVKEGTAADLHSSVSDSENVMHIFATIILMVGCGLSWTIDYIKLVLSHLSFHTICVAVMLIMTGTLRWWYYTEGGLIFYCIVNGLITGLLHVHFSEVLSKITKSKVGLFNGLYGFCFGVSGVIGNIIAAFYINPDNVTIVSQSSPYNLSGGAAIINVAILNRTNNMWFIYAAIFGVLYVPGIYFITYRNKCMKTVEEERSPLIVEPAFLVQPAFCPLESSTIQKLAPNKGIGESFAVFFRSKEAYFYLSCTVSIGIASLVSSDLYKVFGLKVYQNDQFFNKAGIVVPIIGATGRIVWGTLYDYLHPKFIYSFNSLLVTGSVIGMSYTREHPYVYIFLVAVTASSLGMMSCLAPSIKARYSTCSFSLLLGLAMCGEVIGTLIYMLVTSFLADHITDVTQMLLLSIAPGISFILSVIVL